tara:strand:+ start:21827 stop:23818 length:1992 start_codon:yes stop_codon:yes gene_type:complete
MASNNNPSKNANLKNPRNPDSPLFKRLTRLLSGPIVNRRVQMQRRYKRAQLDKYNFTSAGGMGFKRTSYNPYDNLSAQMMANQNRHERYLDFDQMEYMPEIASALDIYADEMTTSTILSPLLKIDCPNDEIKVILDNLYHKILNIDSNLFGWCRSLCKFGDYFMYIDIDEDIGVKNVVGLPNDEVERLEGEDRTNPNYVQYQWNSGGLTFENWQIAHFRVLGNDKYSPYGTSVLEPARRIWRQLTLLEDAMMAYRIVRSPERRVFYIDVGNIPANDVEQFMQKVITTMKRNQVVDTSTGRVDLRYNPMSIDEDYFMPVRGGESSRIESLPGGTYTGDIDDVKYLRDKLFSALKVPMSYLSRGEGGEEDKTTLAQKDIRFARTIQRLQRSVISELEKIGIIHLFTLGFRGDDLIGFTLSLQNPSKIAEMQELEHWRTKFDVASAATEGFFSKRWIAHNLFGMSEEEFLRNHREMFYDKKFEASLEQAAEGDAAEDAGALGGGGGGGLGDLGGGGDLGGDLGGGDEAGDLGADLGGGEEGGDLGGGDEGGDDDSALLAAPAAKRDDGGYTTPRSKDKVYYPVKTDTRGMGARKRSMVSQSGAGIASNSIENIYKGMNDMSSLARGIYEEKQTIYDKEETKLGKVSGDVSRLLESLERKGKTDETQ